MTIAHPTKKEVAHSEDRSRIAYRRTPNIQLIHIPDIGTRKHPLRLKAWMGTMISENLEAPRWEALAS
jgi:hypothetical protein